MKTNRVIIQKILTPKFRVLKTWPTAVAMPPNPRGIYYGEWNIMVPPTSVGIFGPMARILGHGKTAKEAWLNAATRETK